MNQKRYLVTGGCGFIGSHLADTLIARGHKVTILDDLSNGKKENAHPHATLIVGDTTDYNTVERACIGMDGCFHLAAITSVEKSTLHWTRSHQVNVSSAVNVFQAASASKMPVVYASSAAVYGDCQAMPIAEDAPTRPLSAYGADKLGCELHGRVAWQVHSVPTMGLRAFNIYGPRQDPSSAYSGVVSIFADRMRQKLPITIYGDGEQSRDFVHVSDAVKVFIGAMERLYHVGGCDVLNLCSGSATSIKQLADTIASMTDYSVPYRFAPPRRGDIRLSLGNPARLMATLAMTPTIMVSEGLGTLLSADVIPEKIAL